ncbi:MAG: hypothetical protein H7A23_04720 [Leptospiraceae bacterium]|nr:hypothetical protein [Leptospiraceae bacterium]MCP5493838.1 hypothetical protein [Leptospiraceae bacterium]
MNRLEDVKTSFGALFFVANRLETLIDRYLAKYHLTTKQFFLSLVLIQNQKPALTLGQVSRLMGTTRQNVKQLALKLEKRGFCKITPDLEDKRILRLSITKKNSDFWNQIDEENVKFLNTVFQDMDDEILEYLAKGLKSLFQTIEKMEEADASLKL